MKKAVRVCACAGIVAGAVLGGPGTARASGTPALTGAYLFSNWSSPMSGASLYVPNYLYGTDLIYSDAIHPPPPIRFQGTSGVELLMTGSTVTGIRDTGHLTLEIDQALTYGAHDGQINEGGQVEYLARHGVNIGAGIWGGSGVRYDPPRPELTGPASVSFNPVSGPGVRGYNALIIAENARFNPLGVSICSAEPGGGCQSIISTFDPAAINALLSRPDFVAANSSDVGEMDQVYVFLFDGPVSGSTTVGDIYGRSERPVVDFVGTATVVPIPGAAWLFGDALVTLGALRRANRVARSV